MKTNDIEKFCNDFFKNSYNRFIMNMFAVHDGEMTLKQALEQNSDNAKAEHE